MRQVTHRRLLQQAHQKSGSFPPPALPSFIGTTTQSDSRSSRCPTAPLRPLPSLSTGLPRLRDPLSRRAVPITPVDRSRCVCRLLPQIVLPSPNSGRVGIHNFPFEACSGFIRITAVESLARPRRTLSQGFDPADCSTEPPASYRANRPLPGWDLHPQGDRPLRGAPEFRREVKQRFAQGALADWQMCKTQVRSADKNLLRETPCEFRETLCRNIYFVGPRQRQPPYTRPNGYEERSDWRVAGRRRWQLC